MYLKNQENVDKTLTEKINDVFENLQKRVRRHLFLKTSRQIKRRSYTKMKKEIVKPFLDKFSVLVANPSRPITTMVLIN